MRMGQGVRTGLGHGGITCVLQTQFSSFVLLYQQFNNVVVIAGKSHLVSISVRIFINIAFYPQVSQLDISVRHLEINCLVGGKYCLASVKVGSKINIPGGKIWWPYNSLFAICTGRCQI